MSNPFAASDHASPGPLVRSSEAPVQTQDVPPATPSAESEAITSAEVDSLNGDFPTPSLPMDDVNLRKLVLHGNSDGFPPNEEDDSDASTPRLPPARGGSHDFDDFLSEDNTSLEAMHPPVARKEVALREFQEVISQKGGITTSVAQSIPTAEAFNSHPVLHPSSALSSYHAISHQSGPRKKDPSQVPSTMSHPETWREARNSHDSSLERPGSVSNSNKPPMRTSELIPEKASSAHNHRTEAFGEQRNRSTSRGSHGRVEKNIEATLPNEAPKGPARSRKSSHVMGLFKENNTPEEARQNLQVAKSSSVIPDSDMMDASRDSGQGNPARVVQASTSTGKDENISGVVSNRSADGVEVILHGKRRGSGLETEAGNGDSPSDDSPTSDTSQERDPKTASDLARDAGDKSSRKKLPSRLLQEIREHHNLGAPVHDKFRRSQGVQRTKSQEQKVRVQPQNGRSETEQCRAHGKESAQAEEHDGDEEGSDKEQISSALYYPHEAPSPDALQDVSIEHARKRKDAEHAHGEVLPAAAISTDEEDGGSQNEVDLSLQSRNRSRHLHGDLPKARPSAGEQDFQKIFESSASASESEAESQGYSSYTDDAVSTPKASPESKVPSLQSKGRKKRPAAPLGAVELKPYNHQVGGHTTVFRFSKRAVCKQLTSRENRFYELVERFHPELMKFLPK